MAGKPGRSGRKKQPAALKKAKGTYRPPRDQDGASLPAGVPPVPDGLNPQAAREWARLAPLCLQAGLLTHADWIAWELGFWAYSTWLNVSKSIGDPVWITKNDYPVQRPEVAIAQKAWSAVLQFCREFGLTPSARSGLRLTGEFGGGETKSTDPLESMLD